MNAVGRDHTSDDDGEDGDEDHDAGDDDFIVDDQNDSMMLKIRNKNDEVADHG